MGSVKSGIKNKSAPRGKPEWYGAIAEFERPDLRKTVWQLVDTLVPYGVLWFLMIRSIQLDYAYWVTLALALPAGGLLVRVFALFHDCCHGSFFRSNRANRAVGYFLGSLCFTPFDDWRHSHWRHHATAANLDYRGTGDVWTLTVEEYLKASPLQKQLYRLFRNPLVLFGLGPLFYFVISERFSSRGVGKMEHRSVVVTNLVLAAIALLAAWTIGLGTYVMIQLPVLMVAATAGVWLFYVQHQFEGVYWARRDNWSAFKAALEGSSFYKLPRILQWFSGNIGLHYIHHVRPRVPNYNLERCYHAIPELQTVKPLSMLGSLKSLRLRLWDEAKEQLVGFRALRS